MRKFLCMAGAVALPLMATTSLAIIDAGNAPPQMPTGYVLQSSNDELPLETRQLMSEFPGVRVEQAGGRISHLWGKPMTVGDTPNEAVDAFLAQHVGAFGQGEVELNLEWSGTAGEGKFTVYGFSQTIDGAPVEHGMARVLVLNSAPARVVYASGILAARPEGGFPEVSVTADGAQNMVSNMLLYKRLEQWSQPQLAVFFGSGPFGDAQRVWKFTGQVLDRANPEGYTFFVNASTGRLVWARYEVLHADVSGTVSANVTPGSLPDTAANPEQVRAMPDMRTAIGGTFVFSDVLGAFTIPNAGVTPVDVTASVVGGEWASVNDSAGGTEIGATATGVTPPGPAGLLLNPTPAEFLTAQANGYYQTTLTHNFFDDRWDLTILDRSLPVNVNIDSSCNANFSPINIDINFFRAAGGCVNTAYSSVVNHEYGHFVVNRLGLTQGGFGEGFGDCVSILMNDDPVIGRNFSGSSAIRTPETANIDYPCSSGAIHTCGQIVGGFWWDVRERLGVTYGSAEGLALTQNLFVDWAQITNGGDPSNGSLNSAYPATASEVLTVDDDNGDIEDGTPNYADICAAFGTKGISCPAVPAIGFAYPDGLPDFANPAGDTTFRVEVIERTAMHTANSLQILYRGGASGVFTTANGSLISGTTYNVTIPQFACGTTVQFYVSVNSTQGVFSSPSNAPTSVNEAVAATGIETLFADDLESNLGWTVGQAGDNATTGIWTRVNPNGTAAQPEDDNTGAPGVTCFVTGQGSAGGSVGENDVDSGTTTLISPVVNLSGATSAQISYWRWYSNSTGAAPNADSFLIDVTSDGTNWVNVETIGPAGPQTGGGWFFNSFNVADFAPLSATVRVRFRASDLGSGSIVEAAIDDFSVSRFLCDALPTPCPADLNGDRQINLTDLATLLSNFGLTAGATAEQGDLNGDEQITLTDLAQLLSVFGTPCPD
ncbi:MAG: dockerin type I domain-containing protein [Phycisphaerae bacterium]